ncbi:MAG: amidohydrolase family protein [Pseudomonadota bacterium]
MKPGQVMRVSFIATAAVGVSLATSPAVAERYAIRDVSVIDGTGRPAVQHRTVLIDGARIAAIGNAKLPVGRAKIIDGRGKFLTPGLIDTHIHLREAGPDGIKHSMDLPTARATLAGFLAHGFTTVADLGNLPGTVQKARDIDPAQSPRLLIAGRLFTAPGGRNKDIGIGIGALDPEILAKHRREDKPDLIKIVEDEGGFGGQSLVPALSPALMRGIVKDAHRHGLVVVAHVAREADARRAIDAGVDGLAHPVWAEQESDAFVRLVAARRIPFATTLAIADRARLPRPETLSGFAAWRAAIYPIEAENVARIVRAGGVAALGTDMVSGAASYHEMELLVAAGLPPLKVISIATANAAAFLGRSCDFGTITPGKRADILLLDQDPAADIGAFKSIHMIIRDGNIVDRRQLQVVSDGP